MANRPSNDRPGPERDALDEMHNSGGRGEHRYPDATQTAAERSSRTDRDNLKRRLAGTPLEPMPHDHRYRADVGETEKAGEGAVGRPSVVDDLRDLITALDRRTPQLERKGERDIAIAAAALRAEALHRIAELDGTSPAAEGGTLPKD